ncbi:hypothetical protein [Actinomycetospora soli]|uniref:hypothetical protein n=1 Tax=Actinomycetospora soli TaxID=2893887 RepID=UPI001E517C6A|nr:hypothetical protein [Actinomycetospora soli]MCD2187232.1 hypothetical protein [Actinomycetospora soli]
MAKRAPSTWVDTLARLRPRDRAAAPAPVVPTRPAPVRTVVDPAQACALTGAKRAKKKCCRSTPRCKGCPVVLMRAARAAESGLTGKDLAKAVKRARAA